MLTKSKQRSSSASVAGCRVTFLHQGEQSIITSNVNSISPLLFTTQKNSEGCEVERTVKAMLHFFTIKDFARKGLPLFLSESVYNQCLRAKVKDIYLLSPKLSCSNSFIYLTNHWETICNKPSWEVGEKHFKGREWRMWGPEWEIVSYKINLFPHTPPLILPHFLWCLETVEIHTMAKLYNAETHH